ncbi:MAG: transcriptional repressor [Phycisphaeraceae bacterium]|nr:transcriptional repressor [Phycisphaeraceae bacterium]
MITETLDHLFTSRGLRCTSHRRTIYRALAATTAHPTVDELYQQLDGRMSLATVYNTLESFCKTGLVRKIPGSGENGSARYDATTDPHMHACDPMSGRVVDVPDELSRAVFEQIPKEQLEAIEKCLGFRIHDVRIDLTGEFVSARNN